MAGEPLSDPKPSSECVHCGFCLETCPTYVLTGKEEESPRGRILLARALEEGRLPVERATLAPLDHCLGCLACETACPSGVVYRNILFEARRHADAEGHVRHPLERWLLGHVITRPRRLAFLVFFYKGLGARSMLRAIARVPLVPSRWRERARLSPTLETGGMRAAPSTQSAGRPRAILLRGCAARVFMPATEDAMAHLLEEAGYRVERRDQPECCGALAHHAGMRALAQELAIDTVDQLHAETDAILVPTAAGCGAHLRELSHVLLPGSKAREAEGLAGRVRDLSQALLEAPRPLRFHAEPSPGGVVFQDPCHLRHAQGIVEEPRRLLRNAGATLVETPEADLCCGSAGSYHLALPELAAPLARRKCGALLATGATTVVTANPGCWMHLRAVWPGDGPRLTTLARFLEERLARSDLPGSPVVPDHSFSPNSGKSAP